MQLYREENIRAILGQLDKDEYDDAAQDVVVGATEIPSAGYKFMELYLANKERVLELGCGSGSLFDETRFVVTHAIEPCESRFRAACDKAATNARRGIKVRQCVVEAIEFEDRQFDGAFMLNGWFQLRSDYEALIEVNRVLEVGGTFVINLLTNDNIEIVCGRVYGWKNYARLVSQFGFALRGEVTMNAGPRFEPREQTTTFLAFEKVREFDPRWLSLPQVKSKKDVINYLHARDWTLL